MSTRTNSTRTLAGADGVARLRVPYATDPPLHPETVASQGPSRVRSAAGIRAGRVSESDVQTGAVVAVSLPSRGRSGSAKAKTPNLLD